MKVISKCMDRFGEILGNKIQLMFIQELLKLAIFSYIPSDDLDIVLLNRKLSKFAKMNKKYFESE